MQAVTYNAVLVFRKIFIPFTVAPTRSLCTVQLANVMCCCFEESLFDQSVRLNQVHMEKK